MLKIKRKTKNIIIFILLTMFVIAAITVYMLWGLTKFVGFVTLSGMAVYFVWRIVITMRGEGNYTDGIAWYDCNGRLLFYDEPAEKNTDDHPIPHIHIP